LLFAVVGVIRSIKGNIPGEFGAKADFRRCRVVCRAWGPAGIAYHIANRPLLHGQDRSWLDEWRRRLDDIRLRGLECFAQARLGLGGPTLPQAETCGRRLIELAPYRESGHRILMEALARRGNAAEALLVYDRLRILLRDELGIAPSPAVQSVYRRLLDQTTTTA